MSKPKVWTLPELLDRIWMLSRGKRTAVAGTVDASREKLRPELPGYGSIKRVVTGWGEDYQPRTYELNKISAASAAALYERIKTMRAKQSETPSAAEKATGYREPLASQIQAWNDGYVKGLAAYQTVNQPPSLWEVARQIPQMAFDEQRKEDEFRQSMREFWKGDRNI